MVVMDVILHQTIPIRAPEMSRFCKLVTSLLVPMVGPGLMYNACPVKLLDIIRISARLPCNFSKPQSLHTMKAMMAVTSSVSISLTLVRPPVLLTTPPPGLGVVMDTGSTINTIKDSELLTNIKRVRPGVKVLTNGGEVIYDMMGTFQGVLKAWYNPDGMANILSFSALCNILKVSFVSAVKNMFLAEFSDGRLWQFVEANNGLFYYNPDVKHTANASNNDVLNYCFVSTVADNESKYYHREVAAAKISRKIHRSLGRPAQKIFESALTTNQFKNFPVTVEDVKRHFAIYGPDVASFRVKQSKDLVHQHEPPCLRPFHQRSYNITVR